MCNKQGVIEHPTCRIILLLLPWKVKAVRDQKKPLGEEKALRKCTYEILCTWYLKIQILPHGLWLLLSRRKGRISPESSSIIFFKRGSPNWFKNDNFTKLTGRKFHWFYIKVFNIWRDFHLSFLFVSRISSQSKWLPGASKQMAVFPSHNFCRYCKLSICTMFWNRRGDVEGKEGRIQWSGNSWLEKDRCS